ncbi:MAG TPA: discoidin domain-containing protein [Armatimonadota bacterium]|nr:discoidin domain-containing protein [Armatimonadota bacterium]
MRGAARPDEQFTDALPRLNDAGIAPVLEAGITQVLVSLDTAALYPGRYAGRLTLESTLDKATRREIGIALTVLPRQLPTLDDLDITDCFGHIDYAWPALAALGVNTFSLSASWADVEFDDEGRLARFEGERIDRMARRILEDVPDARFLLLNVQKMLTMVTRQRGWPEDDPRVEAAIRSWLERIAECLRDAGVSPESLIVETWDEPGAGDRAMARRMAQWVKQAAPEARTQFYVTGIDHDEDWALTARAHDIVAPIVAACTEENMSFLQPLTKQVWLYDCQVYAETFHPVAYYRLMPWTARAYGLAGWGQFHWFNTSHGRSYRAWDGVEAQNLVYPSRDGRGWVATRRYLAARAGHEDYAALRALEQDTASPEADGTFIDDACNRALAMAPRQKGYHTRIQPDADPELLDGLRREAVERLAASVAQPEELPVALSEQQGETAIELSAPTPGRLRVRWLVDGALPWLEMQRDIPAGDLRILLTDDGEVTRCLVDLVDARGAIRTGLPLLTPTITVDSVSEAYGARVLNDGVRAVAAKFEPGSAWVSSADPTEHWVEMDLGREHLVREVTLYWMTFAGLPRKTRVDAVDADGGWHPVSSTPSWRQAPGPSDRVTFTPVSTRRLRVIMAPLGGGQGGPALMGLSEVEIR